MIFRISHPYLYFYNNLVTEINVSSSKETSLSVFFPQTATANSRMALSVKLIVDDVPSSNLGLKIRLNVFPFYGKTTSLIFLAWVVTDVELAKSVLAQKEDQ